MVIEADAFKESDVIYRALSSRGHVDMIQTAELVSHEFLKRTCQVDQKIDSESVCESIGSPVINRCSIITASDGSERREGCDNGWDTLLGTFRGADDNNGEERAPSPLQNGKWIQGW